MAHGQKKPRKTISRDELAMRNPVWGASKRQPMEVAQIARLIVEARMAFHRIVNGEATEDDPECLGTPSNIAMVLCERDVGEEYLPQVQAAQAALLAAHDRERDVGKPQAFTFTEDEAASVSLLLDLFEQQLAMASHLEVMQALAIAIERVRSGDVIRGRS